MRKLGSTKVRATPYVSLAASASWLGERDDKYGLEARGSLMGCGSHRRGEPRGFVSSRARGPESVPHHASTFLPTDTEPAEQSSRVYPLSARVLSTEFCSL